MQRHALLIAAVVLGLAMNGSANAATTTTSTTTNTHVLAPMIAAPYNLRRTTDKNECFSHGGGAYCQDQSQLRQPVLIWEWNGNLSSIDGFRFYKVTGGRHLDVTISSNLNQKITWDAWTAHPGTCFAVTAFKGTTESSDSNKYCMPFVVQAPMPAH
jgi:hypothetical protein